MANLLKKLKGKKSTKSVDAQVSDGALKAANTCVGEVCSDGDCKESAFASRYKEVVISDTADKIDCYYSRNFIVSDNIMAEYYKQYDNVTFDETDYTITDPYIHASFTICNWDKVLTIETNSSKENIDKRILGLNQLIEKLTKHRNLIIKAINCTTDEDIRAITKA